MSFSVFFMSFSVGERLGLGVTLVLAIEFARLSLAANLPVCGEWLWLEMLFQLHFFFATFSLMESSVVRREAHGTTILIPWDPTPPDT